MSSISIVPSGKALGAVVHGLDLSQPLDDPTFNQVRDAFDQHGVIAIRGYAFNDDDHLKFSARFGPLRKSTQKALPGESLEIMVVSNIKRDGQYIGRYDAGLFWHTDGPFLARPHGPSALHAYEVPVRDGRVLGDTLFSSTAVAYDMLSDAMKRTIADLKGVNSLLLRHKKAVSAGVNSGTINNSTTGDNREAIHPVVRVHPRTGKKCIYVSEGFTERIVDMPEDESRALLAELFAHCAKPEFHYRHTWQVHDLVMWDNCSTQHKATFDYEPLHRLMHRTTLDGY